MTGAGRILVRGMRLGLLIVAASADFAHAQWCSFETPWRSEFDEDFMSALLKCASQDNQLQQSLRGIIENHEAEFVRFLTETAHVREANDRVRSMRRFAAEHGEFPPTWNVAHALAITAQVAQAASEESRLDEAFILQVTGLLHGTPAANAWLVMYREFLWRQVARMSSRVPACTTNLVVIVNSLSLSSDDYRDVSPVLSEYETALLGLHVNMLQAASASGREYFASYFEELEEIKARSKTLAPDAAQALANEFTRKWERRRRQALTPQVSARNANRDFSHRIADRLPAQVKGDFWWKVMQADYPGVYPEQLPAAELAEHIRSLADATPAQLNQVDEIMLAMSGTIAAEATASIAVREQWFDRWLHKAPASEVVEIEKQVDQRRTRMHFINQETMSALLRVLTPEQQHAWSASTSTAPTDVR